MPGLAELREWLREETESWERVIEQLKAESKPDLLALRYARGSLFAFSSVLARLESLDSSPDLPSTKG